MSDNPWNVNRKRRSERHQTPVVQRGQTSPAPGQAAAAPPIRPVQTQHPLTPTPQDKKAAISPIQAESAQSAGTLRAEKHRRKPISPLQLVIALVMVVLGIILARAILYNAAENLKYQQLVSARQEEMRRIQAHKDEHLLARANSGYMKLIQKYATEYGVSPSFVSAIIKCESSFRPDAVSNVNARGLMQIMPNTGPWLANRLKIEGYQAEMLFDPDFNIRLGVSYLAYLSNTFSGNPVMTAAAYHAGDNNVKRWALNLAQDKKTITLDQIPTDDTRSYVRKVMDAYAIYYEEDLKALQSPGAVSDPAVSPAPGGADD